jgi:hypothetical protein
MSAREIRSLPPVSATPFSGPALYHKVSADTLRIEFLNLTRIRVPIAFGEKVFGNLSIPLGRSALCICAPLCRIATAFNTEVHIKKAYRQHFKMTSLTSLVSEVQFFVIEYKEPRCTSVLHGSVVYTSYHNVRVDLGQYSNINRIVKPHVAFCPQVCFNERLHDSHIRI